MTVCRRVLLVTLALSLVLPAGAVSVGGVASTTTVATAAQADGINVERTHPTTNLSTFDAVMDASTADTLDRSEVAVPGDVLVLRLDRVGIGAAIANASGEDATERFRSWLARDDTSLRFAPVNRTGPALDPTGPGLAVRSGTAYDETRTYLLVRTGTARFGDGLDRTRLEGRTYRFTASDGDATLTSDPVAFEAPSVSLPADAENGSLTLERPTADVRARSSLPPGTPTTVSLVAEGGFTTATTVPLDPPGTELPDRFTQLDARLDTASAPTSGRIVFAFANRAYPYPATLREVNATVAGTPLNGSLRLETSRARGDLYASLTNATAIRAARERGDVVRSTLPVEGERTEPGFVTGDLLVVRLESERLAALLRDRAGETPTERFRRYLHDTDAALRVVQTPDTTTPERLPKRLHVRDSRFRVVADGDTRWVLLDTGNASVVYGEPDGETEPRATQLRPGEAYHVSFAFPGTEELPAPARDRVSVARHSLEFELPGGKDLFFATPGVANVTVRSTLAPGHEATVVLEDGGESLARTVELGGENLTAATARFALPNATDGDTFGVGLYVGRPSETEMRLEGASVDRTTLTVDEPTGRLRIADRSPTSVTVTGELSRGGTLALESVDGAGRFDIANVNPGQFEEVLTLPSADYAGPVAVRVVAYRSLSGDVGTGDPYVAPDGDPVSVKLNLEPNTTPERTHTPETPPPTRTDDDVPDPGTTIPASERTSDDGPGFGALAAGVALLGLALLARRR